VLERRLVDDSLAGRDGIGGLLELDGEVVFHIGDQFAAGEKVAGQFADLVAGGETLLGVSG